MRIRYEYKRMGRALVDAGLVVSAREYAVPPDHHANPFEALSRALRALALGYCTDVDDSAAWPTAKQAICPVGRESGATFPEGGCIRCILYTAVWLYSLYTVYSGLLYAVYSSVAQCASAVYRFCAQGWCEGRCEDDLARQPPLLGKLPDTS